MAPFVSWYTSSGLIEAVKRKIAIPIAQGFLSAQDILDFATEELLISQVPDVMQFHQEYFVYSEDVPLVQNQAKYKIPDRAIGMRLRDVWFKDENGNLFEMSRIAPDDKAYYQRLSGSGAFTVEKYYLKGNYVHLTDYNTNQPGSLVFEYFLRPNRLVPDERACYLQAFTRQITINNSSLVALDTITIGEETFTAVAGSPSNDFEFQIGATSSDTATNLAASLVSSSQILNVTTLGNIVTFGYELVSTETSVSNNAGTTLQAYQGLEFTGAVPENIISGSLIDLLQTKPGHMLLGMNVKIPQNGVSGNSVIIPLSDVPFDMEIGDYIALSGECIIPMIPTDLHTNLADKTCVRVLAAMGDREGANEIKQKLGENAVAQGSLLDNRVEGSTIKIIGRHSLLRMGKIGPVRRF